MTCHVFNVINYFFFVSNSKKNRIIPYLQTKCLFSLLEKKDIFKMDDANLAVGDYEDDCLAVGDCGSYDVVVVGAGMIGSSAAKYLPEVPTQVRITEPEVPTDR